MNSNSNITIKQGRDQAIDILRCIGLFAIFLAHVNPSDLVFRIRNFDVILMVICMTWSYSISRNKRNTQYGKYIIKRFKRLIVPTWVYLTILLAVTSIIAIVLNRNFRYSRSEVIMGYLLLDKVTYIWIMRVYLYIAILSPILYFLSTKIKSSCLYFAIVAAAYFVYTRVCLFGQSITDPFNNNLFNIIVLQLFGWGIAAAIGIRLFYIKENKIKYAAATIIFSGIFIYEMIANKFATTQYFKYPPKLYYISYGIVVGLILYIVLKLVVKGDKTNPVIAFVSKNSMELYFTQALLLEVIDNYFPIQFSPIRSNFVVYWIFLIISSIILTYILKRCIMYIKSKFSSCVTQ